MVLLVMTYTTVAFSPIFSITPRLLASPSVPAGRQPCGTVDDKAKIPPGQLDHSGQRGR